MATYGTVPFSPIILSYAGYLYSENVLSYAMVKHWDVGQAAICKYKFQEMPYLPHSLDLTSCDYHLFQNLKETIPWTEISD